MENSIIIDRLCNDIGYVFKKPDLIEEALRHSSYVNECRSLSLRDNERFEFLGDAVLDLAISHILMDIFQDLKEGDLSKYRATVVNEKSLCRIANELGLGKCILLGKGEEQTNGREKPSILANTLEALLGALYLDAGFSRTKEIIHGLFLPLIEHIESRDREGDYKSLLQELTQDTYKTLPEYSLKEESGPAHDKTFKIVLLLNGKIVAEGEGKSKKEAEQKAAREAFHCLSGNGKTL